MKVCHDLSNLQWTLSGYAPYQWQFQKSMELGLPPCPEIPPIQARVPGSVQQALLNAGLLPDWNIGLNARKCEWVENRHWAFSTLLPNNICRKGATIRLSCDGLDYSGWILLNGREVGRFSISHLTHTFDLTNHLREGGNRLLIIFDCPPRWLGQFGYTSRMTEWKPRFNYTWDWSPRLVQIGIWDSIALQITHGPELGAACRTGSDSLWAAATGGPARLTLRDGNRILRQADFLNEICWRGLPVEKWWPNGHGKQKLYSLTCELPDGSDRREWRVGFKDVRWEQCHQAPLGADPWICVINGKPIFLQGVNWVPIRPNFADLTDAEMLNRLKTYRELGCNLLRVWGGALLEKESFYRACDELGLMVWQEFPLSSSGIDNWPPESEQAIDEMQRIAESFIERRRHHVSLLLWCGGNELQGSLDGGKLGVGRPVDASHPMIMRLKQTVERLDPGRRFLPTSASGPRFVADPSDFGKGLHWDVHGPWKPESEEYWRDDDALFRSEVAASGASSAELIREYAGNLPVMPPSADNQLWRRNEWWIEIDDYRAETGEEPSDLDSFVAWSQARQARMLERAVKACKERFPRCGGILIWGSHDCFPCTASPAILDFHGNLKPAAEAVGRIFRS